MCVFESEVYLCLQLLLSANFSIALLFNPNHKRIHSVSRHLKYSHKYTQTQTQAPRQKPDCFILTRKTFGELLISQNVESSKQRSFLWYILIIKLKLKRCVVFQFFFDLSLLFTSSTQ